MRVTGSPGRSRPGSGGLTAKRTCWFVVVGWLLLSSVAGVYQPKLTEAVTSDTRLFLPDGTESSRVDELVRSHFTDGADSDLLVVYHRPGGLTDADEARVTADGDELARVPGVATVGEELQFTEDRSTAVRTVRITDRDSDAVDETVSAVRSVARSTDGPVAEVTGAPAVTTDARALFVSIDLPLLLGTAGLVLVILLVVYRSVLLAVVPLGVVTVAYTVAAGLVYGLIQAGLTVDGQSASLLVIVMFGAGTDYCLVLLARYREELAAGADERAAMARTLRRTAPTVVASAVTVIIGLLCLLLASLGSFRALGPVAAIGVAVVLLACLTLLPAVVLLAGARRLGLRRQAARGRRGAPQFVARALRTPHRTAAVTTALLVVAGTGLLAWQDDSNVFGGFRQETESQRGADLLAAGFGAGAVAPLTAVTTGSAADAATDREMFLADPGVASVSEPETSARGDVHRMRVVLAADPYSPDALTTVESLRESSADTLVGGTAGVQADLRSVAARDFVLIVTLVLIAVGLVVALLLRAVVAALLALATVVLSYAATLGVACLLLTGLLGQDGVVPTIPLLAFVFLVSLGIDYTLFLLARVREFSSAGQPVDQAVRNGLDSTWSVVTSAGLVLAGTFTVLTAFPVDLMLQIGLIVALGVLVDTFVVRGVLLPALATLAGPRLWWPRRARPAPDPVPEALTRA
jgi:RND superfamily putative drug exporter